MKTIISTPKAPAAIGPYSQAVLVNGMLFTSGVIPIDPETNTLVEGDVTVQARQAIGNLKNLIEASGSSMDKVVKTTVFIKDMNDFGKINDIYKDFFTSGFPARSCVEVARLPKDVLIEIEAIATVEYAYETGHWSEKGTRSVMGFPVADMCVSVCCYDTVEDEYRLTYNHGSESAPAPTHDIRADAQIYSYKQM